MSRPFNVAEDDGSVDSDVITSLIMDEVEVLYIIETYTQDKFQNLVGDPMKNQYCDVIETICRSEKS